MVPNFNAQIDLTTEPTPDNYSYSVSQDEVVRTVVVNVATVGAALNGVRDFIASKVSQGHVVLRAVLNVTTGPPPQ